MSDIPEKKKWQRPMLLIHTRAEMDRLLEPFRPGNRCAQDPPPCRRNGPEASIPPPSRN
jgi:hypothetical protein